jgi:hypothetical protein
MLHIYKLAQKLKIKKGKRRKSNRIWKHYYFLFSSFLYFPVVDIDDPARCILACIVIVPVLI